MKRFLLFLFIFATMFSLCGCALFTSPRTDAASLKNEKCIIIPLLEEEIEKTNRSVESVAIDLGISIAKKLVEKYADSFKALSQGKIDVTLPPASASEQYFAFIRYYDLKEENPGDVFKGLGTAEETYKEVSKEIVSRKNSPTLPDELLPVNGHKKYISLIVVFSIKESGKNKECEDTSNTLCTLETLGYYYPVMKARNLSCVAKIPFLGKANAQSIFEIEINGLQGLATPYHIKYDTNLQWNSALPVAYHHTTESKMSFYTRNHSGRLVLTVTIAEDNKKIRELLGKAAEQIETQD